MRVGALLIAAVLAGCAATPSGGPTPDGVSGPGAGADRGASGGTGAATGADVGGLAAQGVRVRLRWFAGAGDTGVIAATFTPEQPGFHLYSVDLPPQGVQGVGRPTRVELGGALAVQGTAVVDQVATEQRVAGLDAAVPVYPDGPVTLRLTARRGAGRTLAWVSYAACSATTCLPPVTHQQVELSLEAAP